MVRSLAPTRLSFPSAWSNLTRLAVISLVGICFLGCGPSETAKSDAIKSDAIKADAKSELVRPGMPDSANGQAKPNAETTKPDPAMKDVVKSKNETTIKKKDLPPVNDPSLHADMIEAVDDYLQFAMVNSVAFDAPAESAAPNDSPPKMSNSEDESTHGRKLYYLFAKDITHYLSQDGSPSPAGQALVMESWTSKISNPDARNQLNHASGMRINPRTKVGDKVLEIGQRTDLFIMLKLDAKTGNTDNGWVYGVVDPDTRKVSAAGKVSSCMKCHLETKNDRLFGPNLGDLGDSEIAKSSE